jgi:hypothetical protein
MDLPLELANRFHVDLFSLADPRHSVALGSLGHVRSMCVVRRTRVATRCDALLRDATG